MNKGTAFAQHLGSKNTAKGASFLERQAISMAKSAVCKADVSKVKQRLKNALEMMPDEMVASMIRSSPFCQSGGKQTRKTRKQKRKQRKTRKQ